MLARAFLDYPAMVFANPDAARRRRGVFTLYSAILRDSFPYGEVYTSEHVEGIAAWLPPGVDLPSLPREIRAGFVGLPFTFGWTAFWRLIAIDTCARRLHHKYVTEPHWFLATLGVDPAHQGQGIGSAVLQPVLNRADQERTLCYLETHRPENVRLYERHGFEVQELHQSVHLPPIWAMLRKPR
ncbi:MAG: GNAT family N-acetyltransferase [Planctomycetaceae bacterium]